MDTKIRLRCNTLDLQNPFKGKIPKDVLPSGLQDCSGPFFHCALFIVLGHEFLRNEERDTIGV
jgi:hypothetical protein